MLDKSKYLKKIDDLINLSDEIVQDLQTNGLVKKGAKPSEFRSSTETFIVSIYGANSPFHKNYMDTVRSEYPSNYQQSKGVLLGIRNHIADGWLDSLENKLSAEIFSDYLEMADYLNEEGYYIAAAVIAGTTLEERLRQLWSLHGPTSEAIDVSGRNKPLKAETLNSNLAKFYTGGKNDVKLVTQTYGLRNEAAHGIWNNDSAQKKQNRIAQVKIMIAEIRLFIRNNPI
jgi:hypothetical protein